MSAANGSALAVIEPSNSLDANVGTLMRRATDVAGVCRDIVMKTAQTIQGRRYVRVEGWQSIAVAYGLVASARDVENVYDNTGRVIGVKAIGEVRRMSDGAVVSTAEGFVGEDEPVWAGGGLNTKTGKPYERRPDYARRAMAQTRAVSRACRGALSFVVTLIDSGLSTTPAEEMDGVVVEGSLSPPPPAPVRGNAAVKAALRPSPPQSVGAAVAQRAEEPPPHVDADFRSDAPPVKQSAENSGTHATHDRTRAFRFGNAKNTPLHALAEGDLKFYEGALKRDLANPEKQQYVQSNTLALADVQAEQRYRGL